MSYVTHRPWYPRFGKVGRKVGNFLKWPFVFTWHACCFLFIISLLIYRLVRGKQRFIWDG